MIHSAKFGLFSAVVLSALTVAVFAQAGKLTRTIPTEAEKEKLTEKLMDKVEALLLELPNDGRFGISRVAQAIVPVHGRAADVPRDDRHLAGLGFGTMKVYTLGLFNKSGRPQRIRTGTDNLVRDQNAKLTKVQIKAKEAEVEAVSKAAIELFKSSNRSQTTKAAIAGVPAAIHARAIFPKKVCLGCHTDAALGRPMAVAVITRIISVPERPKPAPKKPTQPPSKR